jgi:hypothetical protein
MKLIVAGWVVVLGAALVQADPVPLTISGTLQVTGTVTEDSGQFLGGLIRNFNNNNYNRFVAEFDLASLGGDLIDSASVTGSLEFRQSGFADMNVEYFLYPADGTLNWNDDWDPAGAISVGTGSAPMQGNAPLGPVDVAAALQTLIDANPGLTHIGFQVDALAGSRSLHEVENIALDVVAIPEPASLAMLCLGGLLAVRRR